MRYSDMSGVGFAERKNGVSDGKYFLLLGGVKKKKGGRNVEQQGCAFLTLENKSLNPGRCGTVRFYVHFR